MKLPIRLENAITKLYPAFHNGELNALECSKCAVGNICSNNGDWIDIRVAGTLGKIEADYFIFDRALNAISKTGYSPTEIVEIEKIFMTNCIGGNYRVFEETKETQFKGLCAVVEYLCELDNIPNVMDYTKLFETENDQPKYELSCKTL